jgi:SAM-dependent methyltransferase
MCDDAGRIIDLYERHAQHWDRNRWRNLFKRPWLARFRTLLPRGGSVLDIGCGSGEPIARHFIEAGYKLTGVDSSRAMIAFCKARFPDQTWLLADMRALSIDARFDGILAWDSFFHLTQNDQRLMFPIFRKHAAPNAVLMFTSGPREGVAMGTYAFGGGVARPF